MYRRYYSVNDMPQMITYNKNEQKPQKKCDDVHIERNREEYEEISFLCTDVHYCMDKIKEKANIKYN